MIAIATDSMMMMMIKTPIRAITAIKAVDSIESFPPSPSPSPEEVASVLKKEIMAAKRGRLVGCILASPTQPDYNLKLSNQREA